jgi:hypothetical protein
VGCCVVSCTTSHLWWHCVLARLLIVCLGAHSWQCPLAHSLLACVRAHSLAHGILSSCELARGILCTHARAPSRLYEASCACAAVTTQRCCCTDCTSCHMQTIYVEQWNHHVFVMIYHTIISCVRTKRKQNSDVFLDLFWLIFRVPKTLVLFLHTTKVPEATREKSAPNKQIIVLWGTKKILYCVELRYMTTQDKTPSISG